MHSFTSLPLWAFVFASVSTLVGAAAVDEQCKAEMCMGGQNVVRALETSPIANVAREAQTNAERLSRGLPPKAPTRRMHAARQQTSPSPSTTRTGKIQVTNENGNIAGFLSTDTTGNGNIKATQDDTQAIKVSFTLDGGATSGSQIRVTMLNSAGPLLGFVEGRDNTTPNLDNSYQYLYLNGVSLPGSGPGASPSVQGSVYNTGSGSSKTAETDVWTIDIVTGAMSAQWINTDGSAPATHLFTQNGYMYAGGNANAFQSKYPIPVTSVTLKFIPDV